MSFSVPCVWNASWSRGGGSFVGSTHNLICLMLFSGGTKFLWDYSLTSKSFIRQLSSSRSHICHCSHQLTSSSHNVANASRKTSQECKTALTSRYKTLILSFCHSASEKSIQGKYSGKSLSLLDCLNSFKIRIILGSLENTRQQWTNRFWLVLKILSYFWIVFSLSCFD